MALLKCIECYHDVSEYADKCPNCGCPINAIKVGCNIKNYNITFRDNSKTVNIIDIEKKISESELFNKIKLTDILMKDYGLSIGTASVIVSVFESNNYKFADDYQKVYDDMCAKNSARVNGNTPKCPTCGSTKIRKISTTERATSVLGLGIMSKKIGKSYKCLNCKYTW